MIEQITKQRMKEYWCQNIAEPWHSGAEFRPFDFATPTTHFIVHGAGDIVTCSVHAGR